MHGGLRKNAEAVQAYKEDVRRGVVHKMITHDGETISSLARHYGLERTTIRRWLDYKPEQSVKYVKPELDRVKKLALCEMWK